MLDPLHEAIHQLNPTATYRWERCDGRSTVDARAAQLEPALAVTKETALTDVVRGVRDVERLQLLEGVPKSL